MPPDDERDGAAGAESDVAIGTLATLGVAVPAMAANEKGPASALANSVCVVGGLDETV